MGTKLLILIVVFLCGSSVVSAQISSQYSLQSTGRKYRLADSLTIEKAITIMQKMYNPFLREKALKLLESSAGNGVPEAMHAMGMIYYQGMDVKQDFDIARKWFEKASAASNPRSAYNLAMMYRLGIGVKQDFAKAYLYLCVAAERGHAPSLYGRGYFLYKGLGCRQNYEEAIKYFTAAANKEHGYAMYMLGLCYRNGYGVERDGGEANFWLQKAAEKKITASARELEADTPENPLRPVKIRSVGMCNDSQEENKRFRRIKHTIKDDDSIAGIYTGTLVTYDWSGEYVIRESPLEVCIVQTGSDITASWREDTLSTVQIKGYLTDTTMVFTHATYSKHDRYLADPLTFDFMNANLTRVVVEDLVFLTGNLQLYSPDNKEPGRPMYLSLQSAAKADKKRVEAATSAESVLLHNNTPRVYPNPFARQLNLSFYLEEEMVCRVEIHSMDGAKIYEESIGRLPSGTHHYQLELDLIAGTYMVRFLYGDKTFTSIIIKK